MSQALGGLAYQALHQRILSASSSAKAQVTCFAAAGAVLVMGIPSIMIGAVAASTGTHDTVVHRCYTHRGLRMRPQYRFNTSTLALDDPFGSVCCVQAGHVFMSGYGQHIILPLPVNMLRS